MAKRRARRLTGPALGMLIRDFPRLLKVLDKHGVTFCAGCYITLMSPAEKAASYHAVPDIKRFLRDVARASRTA